jgi:hypothetical protein
MTMNRYNHDYDDTRFQNRLTAYKPRPWGQEAGMNMPVYSKPEPTSKTKIPTKESFAANEIFRPSQF